MLLRDLIVSLGYLWTKVVSSLEFRVERVLGGILVLLEASMVLSFKLTLPFTAKRMTFRKTWKVKYKEEDSKIP